LFQQEFLRFASCPDQLITLAVFSVKIKFEAKDAQHHFGFPAAFTASLFLHQGEMSRASGEELFL